MHANVQGFIEKFMLFRNRLKTNMLQVKVQE